jgi:diaminopimelate epimerase
MDGMAAPPAEPAPKDLSPLFRGVDSLSQLAGARFWKMTGGGNDFVVFDNRSGWFPKGNPNIVAEICSRGLGVGADAVILLEPAISSGLPFRMMYYNADGSEAPMCGNGAMCIARFARELGLVGTGMVEFETGAGPHRAELFDSATSRVRLEMREPAGIRPSIPEIEALGYPRAGFADTGTPHLVLLVSDLDAHDVAKEGASLRNHPLFEPEGLNIDFIAVLSRHELRIRTYERGVEAETLSCGTGAAAAAVLTHIWGLTEPPTTVHPSGGLELSVAFERHPVSDRLKKLTLVGDARLVFTGVFSVG